MSRLRMPPKGQSAAMMAELQAEHAETGRQAPEPEDTLQEMNVTTNVVTNEASGPAQAGMDGRPLVVSAASREERLARALERAGSDELAVVTVRVPASLNRYMDGFVARMNQLDRSRKYRKQDAVTEAFAAFYADHPMPASPPDDQLQ